MKWLKYLLYFILTLLLIVMIAGALLPKKYTISESITINKPKAQVYDYFKMFKNQSEFSEWFLADPNTISKIEGIDGTLGAKQSWESSMSGVGSQTITNMSNDRIDVNLDFVKPMEGHSKAANIFVAIDSTSTKVTSDFYGDDGWPFNVMSHLFGIPMIRENEKKSLENAKRILESK
jgi:hypothetical protein